MQKWIIWLKRKRFCYRYNIHIKKDSGEYKSDNELLTEFNEVYNKLPLNEKFRMIYKLMEIINLMNKQKNK